MEKKTDPHGPALDAGPVPWKHCLALGVGWALLAVVMITFG